MPIQWITETLEDGRQFHRAIYRSKELKVFDWKDGRITWFIFDANDGNNRLARGKSATADEAMASAKQAAERLP